MARFLPNPNSAILLKDFPSVEAAAAYIRYENKLFKLRIIGFLCCMLPFLFSPPFRKVNEDDQLYLTYLQHKAAFHTGTSQRPLLGFLL